MKNHKKQKKINENYTKIWYNISVHTKSHLYNIYEKGESSILPFFFPRGIKRIELINSFNIQWKEG